MAEEKLLKDLNEQIEKIFSDADSEITKEYADRAMNIVKHKKRELAAAERVVTNCKKELEALKEDLKNGVSLTLLESKFSIVPSKRKPQRVNADCDWK